MAARSARRRAGQVVAVSLAAATVIGFTGVNSVAHAKETINPATGCGEDSFLGGAVSPSNSGTLTLPVGAHQTFSVVYHDESPLNLNPGFTPIYTVTDAGGHVVQSGAPATSPASAPAGTKDKYNTNLSVNWGPSVPGAYTIAIKAWDGDQNKQGGDCGVATWAVNTPGIPTTTTTVPKTTTTTKPPETTTTQPSTPQTNVLGEVFSQAPAAAPVEGTPAVTG